MRSETRISLGLLLACTLVLTLIPAGVTATGAEYCHGGSTAGQTTPLTKNANTLRRGLPVATPTVIEHDLWLDKSDMTVWQDDNGVAGIQRSARVCYTVGASGWTTSSYVVYNADTQVPDLETLL
ncbi:MAG TPA: hypothetical protein VNZ52_16090 [Candidatus Thermoplasmatota archaeon]|nr:hypothetical protein [Candidatus Thermoplasmatota archaeon]